MFEDQVAQARDIIRRLETNVGLSPQQFAALPEDSKIRIEESIALDKVVRWNQMQGYLDLPLLAAQLGQLQEALRVAAKEPDQHMSIRAVAAAEQAAKQGDGPKALDYLKKAGSWVLDVASKIGVNVASSAIKAALGVP